MNRLGEETSPYLRQHAANPVDWYPWGEEAFAEAALRDVPILLSVGYSACHWCHVMAHESFEDEAVASAMAESLVAVKVDREERPDVDAMYMDAVVALTGHGGWPMTVFLTPDGRPFFGGTYFPPADRHGLPGFTSVIAAVGDAWRSKRSEIERQADSLAEAVARRSTLPDSMFEVSSPAAPYLTVLERAVAELADRLDPQWGGFGPAPKFPQAGSIELCLRHHRLTGDPSSLAMADVTLSAMACGGIYDHLGGGFSRYSTDATWTVPHFEKMLYDQAALVRVYLHAWQATGRAEWLQVVEETIDYVLRDLASKSGGWCSAQDADSEGEEGRFYLWSGDEIDAVAGRDAAAVRAFYGVEGDPNFEGRHILRRPRGAGLLLSPEVARGRRALFDARSARTRPGLDDKVLTEWSAMFCSALAEAAAATGHEAWAAAAVRGATFLAEAPRRADGRWLRSWSGGSARHLAYAADYAWLVDCFTRMAELTGRPLWLNHAAQAAGGLLQLFRPDHGPLQMSGSDAEPLLVPPVELLDGATPSATSVAAAALLRLGALSSEQRWIDAGEELLAVLRPVVEQHPLAMAHGLCAMELIDVGVTEVVVTGDRPDMLDALWRRYEPVAVVCWGERTESSLWQGRADGLGFVCRGGVCTLPADSVSELIERLDGELESRRAGMTTPP